MAPLTAVAVQESLRQKGNALRVQRTPVQTVLYAALIRMLGADNAESVDFYVDTRLATQDPERYEQAIELLLGEHGGRMVVHGMKAELAAREGKKTDPKESFAGQVRASERALLRAREAYKPTV